MDLQQSTGLPRTPGGRHVFAAWAAADIVSVVGSRIASLAIPWFVLTTTGSAEQTGAVVMAQLAPMVVTKALAGPVLDRVGPARAAPWLDTASSLTAFCIPALHATQHLSAATLLFLAATLGTLRGPADAAKYALVPDVAHVAQQPMERVTGIAGTTERLASSAAVAGGGWLIAAMGGPGAIVVTAVGFAGSAALLALVVRPSIAAPGIAETSKGPAAGLRSYVRDLADGGSFVRREPVLRAIAMMTAVTNMIDQAWIAVLVPVWAVHHQYGSDTVGTILGTMTGAAIIGSLAAAGLGPRMPRLATYSAGYLIAGLPRYLVFALDLDLPVILTVLAIAGIGSGVLNPIISAVQFERTPTSAVSRVSSLMTATAWMLMPFGGFLGAKLLGCLGLSAALTTLGTVYLAATLAPLIRPSFRAISHRPCEASDGGERTDNVAPRPA
ncbi:MFS transporter [Austwickia sp. TVS 96-490-7B]|uniref:MFS transporter n=1 Tax=Austwickia sp. TVS 96-490-7B TaxID=2830843 RepID=UPI001C57366C|nr:MFS transporter [Austwickia sp. TVS 96-490-7B]